MRHKKILQEVQKMEENVSKSFDTSPLKQSRKIWKKVLRIDLPKEIGLKAFKQMLEFLYTGKVETEHDDIISLISLANEYHIEPLKTCCVDVLGQTVNESNVFNLLDIVERYECPSLRITVSEYFANNFQHLLHSGVLLQLDLDTWTELMKSDDVLVDSEEQIFKAMETYTEQFDGPKKLQIYARLLPHVRYLLLSSEFIKKIEQNPAFVGVEGFEKVMFEAYKAKAGAKTTLRTNPRKGMGRGVPSNRIYKRYGAKRTRYS